MVLSPRKSFEGYSLVMAIYRNKDSVKNLIGLLSGINVAALFMAGFDWNTLLITFGAAFVSLIIKLVQDAVDFYFTEVEL
jgi:hypothetical protein